ncbi:ATP-grasp domain-containing protein [Dactylosporangium vinaceum]|nr:ATP-grasp domain-containing protein [Dactylosporangium vinaceum]
MVDMPQPTEAFSRRLKQTLIGSAHTPLVFLGNFEVEAQWGRDEPRLPQFSTDGAAAVVNAMDEFAVLLAGGDDHVVLARPPDEQYLRYLADAGFDLPTVHVAAPLSIQRIQGDRTATVTDAVLADEVLLGRLAKLAEQGAMLLPHGVSTAEETLAAKTGLGLAAPCAQICRHVNSKVYSRKVADELGLRQPQGWTAESVDEFARLLPEAAALLDTGRKVVVKEAFGVSGKGLQVIDSKQRLERLYRMIAKQAERTGNQHIAFIVESWVDKQTDLNYQCTVGLDGRASFDFVKEALTERGVHKGHVMPARLTDEVQAEVRTAAERIGERLATDGYYGVVGVDALLDTSGRLYPVIEINARNNMSTYQARIQERLLAPGWWAMARHYPMRLSGPVGFGEVRAALGDRLLTAPGRSGLVVNNFATVNAAARAAEPFDGRLYGVVIAGSVEELDAIDADVTRRLATLDGAVDGH